MKRISMKPSYLPCILICLIVLFALNPRARAYDASQFKYIPPFIPLDEAPSVLLLCDTSGSMDQYAYANMVGSYGGYPPGAEYDPNQVYYGYFDPYAYYRYVKCHDTAGTISGFFEENPNGWTDSAGNTHGYFDGDEDGDDELVVSVPNSGVSNYEWCGNFLNYVSMRRMDILKRVLIGGRRAPDNFGDVFDAVPPGYDVGTSMNPFDYLVVGDHEYWNALGTVQCTDTQAPLPGGPTITEPNKPVQARFHTPYGGPGSTPVSLVVDTEENTHFPDKHRPFVLEFQNYSDVNNRHKMMALKLPPGESQPQGIIQKVGTSLRFGLMQFNTDAQGGVVLVPVGNTDHYCSPISDTCGSVCTGYGLGSNDLGDGYQMDGIIEAINNLTSDGNTPLGESLATAVAYFQQNTTKPYHAGDYDVSKLSDPYFFNMDLDDSCTVAADEGTYVTCTNGAVIILTDGYPQGDDSIPAWVPNYTDGGNDGTRRLDDTARYAHITDLRPSNATHDGVTYEFSTVENTLDIYPIFTYGAGGDLLQSTARNGGFIDRNGDNKPNTTAVEALVLPQMKEWDFDDDGLPDNYFEASSGEAIESSLLAAIRDILERAASGTAAAVVANSEAGMGSLYQAIFYTTNTDDADNLVSWIGEVKGLWLDDYGNIREDTNTNDVMDMASDKIIGFYFDQTNSRVRVKTYTDTDEDGVRDAGSESIIEVDDILTVWSAGKLLAQRDISTNPRDIKTWIDGNNNGVVDSGELINFVAANASDLRPYLDQTTDGDAETLINYVLGEEQTGFRTRTINVDGTARVWRLGDIVYSTPTVVARPKENYDFIYSDQSYAAFESAYANRREVVYVGANDGMLHAFNGGFYDVSNHSYSDTTGHSLGEELWAYIPYNLLPHLQALASTEYPHLSYVDLKPKVTDAKIFSPDSTHPGGWGTVLVCGMRFGGGTVSLTDDFGSGAETRTFRSAYFALDITDPLNPALLWEFTDANLGFTTSYPAVIYVDASTWAIAFGSGPTDYDGTSTQYARTFVINLATGQQLTSSPITTGDTTNNNSFMGDPISVDTNIRETQCSSGVCSYSSDIAYIGNSEGKLYRITGTTSASAGAASVLVNTSATTPITSAPAVSMDNDGRFWVYFGTGRFFAAADKVNTDVQALVGVKEPIDLDDTQELTYAEATQSLNVSLYRVFEGGYVDTDWNTGNGYETTFNAVVEDIKQYAAETAPRNYDGWVLGLQGGERCVTKPTVFGGLVTFSTYQPILDICSSEGNSYLYPLYYKTGTAYYKDVIGFGNATLTVGGEDKREIKRFEALGPGVAASPKLHVGKTKGAKVVIQTSTGEIVEIDQDNLPEAYKSRPLHWIQPGN
jgi:Tfp pilus tip-associated adhesin PilY1